MKKAEIEEMFARLERQMPEPRGELNYVNPYKASAASTLS